jgi:GT2 family glycosyltransferase
LQAIVIATVNSPSIHVLLESINQYAPDLPIYVSGNSLELWGKIRARLKTDRVIFRPNTATNFGDAYNAIVSYAFKTGNYDSLIIANDDVVLAPDTIKKMQEDYKYVGREFKVGFLGARSDYILPDQNIRVAVEDDKFAGLKWDSENHIKMTDVIAPIFAAISKEAWETAQFPSTNWYSDNIICHDLGKAGYFHFVSRGYVHHAGSQTVGNDFKKCHEEPREWIKTNRPDMYEVFYA